MPDPNIVYDYVANATYHFTFDPDEQFPIPPSISISIIDDLLVEPEQHIQLNVEIESATRDYFLLSRRIILRITDNDGWWHMIPCLHIII